MIVKTDDFLLGMNAQSTKLDENEVSKEKHLESNAQECFNKLTDYLLGEDYSIVDPVNNYQANEIITHDILMKHSSKYVKEQNKAKRDKKLRNGVKLFRIFGFEIVLRR